MLSRETYVVAVSGGVDSVVLLHKLTAVKPPHITYIVAHFDHGIRPDSSDDAEFVQQIATKLQIEFELGEGKLGLEASEDEARRKRYGFLRTIAKKHKAEAIITAHHQDDVIETMIVNITRGTGPRGLIGFTRPGILRPLIRKTKQELLNYAKKHKLEWREDSTNNDTKYLRNYVRINLMPKLKGNESVLLSIREQVIELYIEADSLTKKMLTQQVKRDEIDRSRFVVLPYIVQKEMMATMLRLRGVEIDRNMVARSVMTIKTLQPGKQIELTKNVKLFSKKNSVKLT